MSLPLLLLLLLLLLLMRLPALLSAVLLPASCLAIPRAGAAPRPPAGHAKCRRCPHHSDVVATSRQAHYTKDHGTYTTFSAIEAFHATRVDWVYSTNGSFVKEVQAVPGITAVTLAMNPQVRHSQRTHSSLMTVCCPSGSLPSPRSLTPAKLVLAGAGSGRQELQDWPGPEHPRRAAAGPVDARLGQQAILRVHQPP